MTTLILSAALLCAMIALFLSTYTHRHRLGQALTAEHHAWQAAAEAEHRAAEWERLALARAQELAACLRHATALGQALRRLGYSAQELEWSDGDITYRITYVGIQQDPPQEVVFHD